MFANLAQCTVLCAQTNSLQACFPDVQLDLGDIDTSPFPANAHIFNGYVGYAFLLCSEAYPSPIVEDTEHRAMMAYWHAQNWPNADTWPHAVCHWAKLQLPNGQKACSVWYETSVTTKLCRSLCVEVSSYVCQLVYC
jgi:hypothetical protein